MVIHASEGWAIQYSSAHLTIVSMALIWIKGKKHLSIRQGTISGQMWLHIKTILYFPAMTASLFSRIKSFFYQSQSFNNLTYYKWRNDYILEELFVVWNLFSNIFCENLLDLQISFYQYVFLIPWLMCYYMLFLIFLNCFNLLYKVQEVFDEKENFNSWRSWKRFSQF